MTSPFQTELRDRAAAHAREWQDARDPSVGLAEVEATVRRRRRGRGLLVGAAAVAGVVVVASLAYGVAGRGSSPIAGPSGSPLAALAEVGPEDVVLTMEQEMPNPSGFTTPYSVVIVDASGKAVTQLSSELMASALGSAGDEWPTVTLVALDSRLDRAIFTLENPVGYTTPRVAILSLASGDVQVVDPCSSPLNSIDLSQWCISQTPTAGGVVIDPETGDAIRVPDYEACSGATARFEGHVVATCGSPGYEVALVTLDPATGTVLSATNMGDAPFQAPIVADGSLYLNVLSKEGGVVMVDPDGKSPKVGGAPAAGLAVLGDRVLVQTGTDPGSASDYGKSIGLWSPSSGEFTRVHRLSDAEAFSVTVVPVLP